MRGQRKGGWKRKGRGRKGKEEEVEGRRGGFVIGIGPSGYWRYLAGATAEVQAQRYLVSIKLGPVGM